MKFKAKKNGKLLWLENASTDLQTKTTTESRMMTRGRRNSIYTAEVNAKPIDVDGTEPTLEDQGQVLATSLGGWFL